MRIALVGLPQAGKKTLFSLLTGRDIPAGRRPEESVEGTAAIHDPRVDQLSAMFQPQKTTYAENHFVLCPDATEGDLARVWLEAARGCDLLCLVIRAFESDTVYHPSGSLDPEHDRTFLETELCLADLETADKRLTRMGKDKSKAASAERALEEQTLRKAVQCLEQGRRLSEAGLEACEIAAIRSLGMLTLLPVLVACNVSESELHHDAAPDSVTVSALIEEEIMSLDTAEERREYLADLGLSASGVDRINAAAYDTLGLMSFYTVGQDEVRAWTVCQGASAPAAGGKIHSDIERGFIRVEVIKYDDLVRLGSERAVKEAGKARLKGKDYTLENGDICHFLFNV